MGMLGDVADKVKASFDAWITKQNEERKKKPRKDPNLKPIKQPIKVPKGGLYGGKQARQLKEVEKE
jgi:hypothetical protein